MFSFYRLVESLEGIEENGIYVPPPRRVVPTRWNPNPYKKFTKTYVPKPVPGKPIPKPKLPFPRPIHSGGEEE